VEVLQSRVLLRPADYDRSVAFYREVLGLHIYREWASGTVFFLGGGRDVDAEFDRLVAAGVEIVEAPVDEPWGLREGRIRDPDGLMLVLVEVLPDHPMRRGRD